MRNRAVPALEHDQTPITGSLELLQPVQVQPVAAGSSEALLFQLLLQRYHYLGHRNCVGQNLNYLARDRQGRPLACLLFGSAAWKAAARDRWIGWEAPQRQRRIAQGVFQPHVRDPRYLGAERDQDYGAPHRAIQNQRLALFIIAVIVLFLFFVIKAMTSNGGTLKKTKSIPKEEQIMIENKGWLEKRWDLAKKEQHAGEFKIVSHWFFDEVTDRQIQKLKEIGLRITSGTPTKGEASDLIGLFEPVEEENAEILRFFKIPLTGMNQSKARHEVAIILSDPDKLEAWKKRPATTSQKEFYNFFNLKVPKGLSYEAALKFISEWRRPRGCGSC